MKVRNIRHHQHPETGEIEFEKLGGIRWRPPAQPGKQKPSKARRASNKRRRRHDNPNSLAPPPTPRQAANDPERLSMRERVLQEAGYQCQQCGSPENLTVDHIIPRHLGGGHHRANLQCLCEPCNQAKGVSLPTEIVLSPEAARTIGRALMEPAPPANAHLRSILQRASQWPDSAAA